MSDAGVLAPRVYRIKPWPVRILIPLTAAVVAAGLLHMGAAAAVPIPILLAVAWIYAAERCGLLVTSDGLESRMTRRNNRFRYAWADIDGFELIDNGGQVAIAMRLRDGPRKLLPSTRSWSWSRKDVMQIYTALERALPVERK